MTTTEENKKIVNQFFEVIEKKDYQKMSSFFTNKHAFHFSMSPEPLDGKGHIETLQMFMIAFPDLTHKVETQIAEGDRVATRGRIVGTHKGEFQGIPATGKKIDISFIEIHRIEDGKIAEEWPQMDVVGMMNQIGAMPEMAH